MRIPLDFYRILGVPIDASLPQIQQAFEDRLQQVPRQQYSNAAITARRKLLQEAHAVLSNPKRRQAYDQQSFPAIAGAAVANKPMATKLEPTEVPALEVDPLLLPGALILLSEVGEYDAVLKIGSDYLNRPIDLNRIPTDASPSDEDITLALALAYLELGRERWQQEQYEPAGESLQSGLDLLRREQKFSEIQTEIGTDLNKLRPYRILELLALPEDEPQRAHGMALLKTMLEDRGGIDGSGDDQSGLNVNELLRFIQQLRDYLTVEEQQTLFSAEARRPSSVAMYLAVYALVARGFYQGRPTLIAEAKGLLGQLADRQDLYLEQSMCSLLLGQPEAASNCLRSSQDREALDYIRQASEGSPDLIPGLYLYTEHWLQQEVYPYFRDLATETVSLEEYFNDGQIQRALTSLEPELPLTESRRQQPTVEPENSDNAFEDWIKTFDNPSSPPPPTRGTAAQPTSPMEQEDDKSKSGFDLVNLFKRRNDSPAPETDESFWPELEGPKLGRSDLGRPELGGKTPQIRSSRPEPTGSLRPVGATGGSSGTSSSTTRTVKPVVGSSVGGQPAGRSVPSQSAGQRAGVRPWWQALTRRGWLPWAVAGVLGLGLVGGTIALTNRSGKETGTDPDPSQIQPESPVVSAPATSTPTQTPTTNGSPSPATTPTPATATATPAATPTATPAATPTATPGATAPAATLSKESAKTLVQQWQTIKAEAMGKGYQSDRLGTVLGGTMLEEWQSSVVEHKADQKYITYTLEQLEVESVTPKGKDQAVVRAKIKEIRKTHPQSKPEPVTTSPDSYVVDYTVARQGSQWVITDYAIQ